MSSKTSSRSTLTTVPSTMSPSLKYLMVRSIAARNASSDPMSLTATLGVWVACVLLVMSWWAPDADRNECCAPRTQAVNARDLPGCPHESRVAATARPGGLTPRRPASAGREAATRPHEDTAQSSGDVVLAGWSIRPGYNSATAQKTLNSSLQTLNVSPLFRPRGGRRRRRHGAPALWLRLPRCLVRRLGPAAARAGGDLQRDAQVGRGAHLPLDQRGQVVKLAGGGLEDQLVVDLQQHAGFKAGRLDRGRDAEHRHLDDVGGRALDRRVERHPLGHLAALPVV